VFLFGKAQAGEEKCGKFLEKTSKMGKKART